MRFGFGISFHCLRNTMPSVKPGGCLPVWTLCVRSALSGRSPVVPFSSLLHPAPNVPPFLTQTCLHLVRPLQKLARSHAVVSGWLRPHSDDHGVWIPINDGNTEDRADQGGLCHEHHSLQPSPASPSLAPAPALLKHSDAVMQRRDHVGFDRIEILQRKLCHVSSGHAGRVQKPAGKIAS